MTEFGDSDDRQYTMVLPDRGPLQGDDPFHDVAHTAEQMSEMAVSEAHFTTATIHPIPLSAEELVSGDVFGEFDVFYMEVETIVGTKHRLMFRSTTVTSMTEAIRNHALVILENNIRRTGSQETIDVMEAIKKLMDRIEREGGGSS